MLFEPMQMISGDQAVVKAPYRLPSGGPESRAAVLVAILGMPLPFDGATYPEGGIAASGVQVSY